MLSLSRPTWIKRYIPFLVVCSVFFFLFYSPTFFLFSFFLGRQQHGVYNNNQKDHNLDTLLH